MSTEIARRRINSFRKRFRKPALVLAYHAALPIALTPDLLYRLWANFKQDIHGKPLEIPWIAVANVLLSTLVDEVGYELYEMDEAVRSELLKILKEDPRFGQERIKELSYFLQAYIGEKLTSCDSYEREFAQAQKLTALAFVEPNQAARELALKLKDAHNKQNQDKYELIRVASFIETLAEPLKDYQPLLTYARGMVNWVLDNNELAISEFKKLPRTKKRSQVEELIFSIPQLQKPVPKKLKFDNFILEKLNRYKSYADSILGKLKILEKQKSSSQNQSQNNQILENPKLEDCLKKIKETAEKTVELASSPVKIAVMGEFSSGKTRLIESLIGYGGILPVSDIPSTGNVTAIHLIGSDDFKTTEFSNFTVEYLSESEVQECLQFMLEEAQQRTNVSELPALPQVDSTSLNQETLNAYENWCEKAWDTTPNLELRYLLQELVIFVRSCINYGTDLYGKNFDIAQKLKQSNNKTGLNQEAKFEDIPSVEHVAVDEKQLSADVLKNSFSLIRRVNINVKISKEIWNLGTTQDSAKFIILDFPGLGTSNLGVRDTFLSLQELDSVQTILILLNARNPGNNRANKIFTMLEEKKRGQDLNDQILVGVSRFNQLLEGGEAQAKLDELIGIKGSLSEETVLQQLDVLKTITNDAKGFTSKAERIVLLDQLRYLRKLSEVSSQVQVGTSEFLGTLKIPSLMGPSEQISEKWKRLSEKLLETNPDSSLGQQLKYFAIEGGIPRLRDLLLNHIADNGLKQLEEDTRRYAYDLAQQLKELEKILSELGILKEDTQALKDLRSDIDKMYSTYNRFKDNELGKTPLKNWEEVTVNDLVKDEITYEILNWKQWNLLLSRAQNGKIVLPSKNNNEEEPFSRRKRKTDKIPTKSDDFYQEFEATVKKLETFADDCIKKAVKNLLDNLSGRLGEEIARLKKILPEKDEEIEKIETDIKEKFGEDEAYTYYVFCDGYNPQRWEEFIISSAFKGKKYIDTKTAFPLAHKNEKHNNGQFFYWAPEYNQINHESSNHILLVLQLRDEITTNISLHLENYVSKINQKVEQGILRILYKLIAELNALLTENALLRYIAGDEGETTENTMSQTISQIALTPFPNS